MNAALPLMAAALLTDDKVTFRDIPDLADIRNMVRLLAELGCIRLNEAEPFEAGVHTFRNVEQSQCHATYDIVRTMRASVCVLGPLLAKRGEARIAQPGGCSIGDRPVDLHLRGLRALGAHITLEQGDIVAKAPAGGLRGATIFLGGRFGSTVLGTANVLSAAVLAKGTPVDLHPGVFPVGKSALTQMAHVGAHLTRVGEDAFDLSVFRGFAESFWEWITEQAEEFGYQVT